MEITTANPTVEITARSQEDRIVHTRVLDRTVGGHCTSRTLTAKQRK